MENQITHLPSDEDLETLQNVYDPDDDDPYMGLWSEAYDEVRMQTAEDKAACTRALGRLIIKALAVK